MPSGKGRDQTGTLPQLYGVDANVDEELAALFGTFIVIAKQTDAMRDVPVPT